MRAQCNCSPWLTRLRATSIIVQTMTINWNQWTIQIKSGQFKSTRIILIRESGNFRSPKFLAFLKKLNWMVFKLFSSVVSDLHVSQQKLVISPRTFYELKTQVFLLQYFGQLSRIPHVRRMQNQQNSCACVCVNRMRIRTFVKMVFYEAFSRPLRGTTIICHNSWDWF